MAPDTKTSYKPLTIKYDGEEEEEEEEEDGSQTRLLVRTLRMRLLFSHMLSLALAMCIMGIGLFSTSNNVTRCGRAQAPLGADPSGLVPPEVGQPASWKTFYNDSRDPYWMDEDTFDSMEKLTHAVRRLKWLHNSTNILSNGRQTTYHDWEGREGLLPAYKSRGHELYGIRSFHQIHCIIVMVDDYGRRLHGESSQWTPEHFMHCLNTMRQLVQCMADATPLSFLNGLQGHIGDGQQMWCRDFDALRHWANDPERGVRYAIVSPEDAVKDVYQEIWPFPSDTALPNGW